LISGIISSLHQLKANFLNFELSLELKTLLNEQLQAESTRKIIAIIAIAPGALILPVAPLQVQ